MKRIVFCVFVLLVIASCKKESSFSPVPVITFKQYISYNVDSADCTISFQDGDGDIGVLSTDTTSYNLFMKYLYKNAAGNFVPYDAYPQTAQLDTLFYSFRIKSLTPDGQYKAISGDITAQLRATPIYNPKHKVVKFAINLWDRAGHESNTVMTDEIIVPQ